MKPIAGIVISVSGTTVRIRIKGGGVISVPVRKELIRGAKVDVDWDHTTNGVHAVWLEGKRPQPTEPEGYPTTIDDFGKEVDKGMNSRAFTGPTFEGVKGQDKE